MLDVQELVACWSLVGQLDVVYARLMFVAKQHVSAASLAGSSNHIALAQLAQYGLRFPADCHTKKSLLFCCIKGMLLTELRCAKSVLVP